MKNRSTRILILLLLPLLGCSSLKVDENDPASLMQDAQADVDSDHYQIAIDKFRAIKNRFPYSNYAAEAQLKIADVYFIQELFAEAAVNYQIFKDLHPKNPKVPYAMFKIAKSYLMDSPTNIERDISALYKAQRAYDEFVQHFPSAPELGEAQKDIHEVRKRLSDKEFLIAQFYFKRGHYEAAKPRYEKVIELYPDTEAAINAKEKLKMVTEKLARTMEGAK